MRTTRVLWVFGLVTATAMLTGCKSGDKDSKTASKPRQPEAQSSRHADAEKPAAPSAKPSRHADAKKPAAPSAKPAAPSAKRVIFTSQHNPTTDGGRGAPSLDDQFRPAAWVLVDGHSGKFVEHDGHAQLEWMINGDTSSHPTFRVEALESLVGNPKDFSCLLRSVSSTNGADIYYAIKAKEGTFQVGKDYSLLDPGKNFVIRNGLTRDVVEQIAPLPPGKYLLATAIGAPTSGKRVLAVSHFTVGAD